MLNGYSVIHLGLYFLLGRYVLNSWISVLVISIGWELLELILPFEFAVETIENKVVDVGMNCMGFCLGHSLRRDPRGT